MPLRIAETPVDPANLAELPEKFLIFYSSIVDGALWCPDCVRVDDLVQKIFGSAEGPSGLIIYVGNRQEWKAAANVFRAEPWNISSIPTIIKLGGSKEVGRLVDDEISRMLDAFVENSTV